MLLFTDHLKRIQKKEVGVGVQMCASYKKVLQLHIIFQNLNFIYSMKHRERENESTDMRTSGKNIK